eukprot:1188129-Prorocentrum_minimum.AAC.1
MTAKLRLSGDLNFLALARATPGYVGADLSALVKEAAALAIRRIMTHLGPTPPVATTPGEPGEAAAAGEAMEQDPPAAAKNQAATDLDLQIQRARLILRPPFSAAELAAGGFAISTEDFKEKGSTRTLSPYKVTPPPGGLIAINCVLLPQKLYLPDGIYPPNMLALVLAAE